MVKSRNNLASPGDMPTASQASSFQGLANLIQENLKLTRELQTEIKKINRWIIWQRVWGVIKLIIIIIPIILGIIYLPPFLDGVIKEYRQLLNSTTSPEEGWPLINQPGLTD